MARCSASMQVSLLLSETLLLRKRDVPTTLNYRRLSLLGRCNGITPSMACDMCGTRHPLREIDSLKVRV
jgi:hypothetical protein